ncbi:MAG: LacI family transcriptional regulator [Clostridiales bacterium]|jgi:LacI family transcriptional regulator|nr:LacI family transcriptional regulator [Clostridiales bacterium]
MITMTEIASLTGVSQATVSRALNGSASVRPEIAKKVLDCAREHNYQPNFIAQSLVGNKTYLIGLVVSDIGNPFFAELAKAIEREARKRKYSIMLFSTDYNVAKEEEDLEIIRRYKTDGLIFTPASKDDDVVDKRLKYEIPSVSVTIDMRRLDSVFVSHAEAGEQVARHFLGLGHESFLFIGSKDDDKELGFLAGLDKGGVDIERDYFYSSEKGSHWRNAVAELVKARPGAAIFAHNDLQAIQVLEALKELEVSVPQDVALAGFDNTFLGKITTPTLTSVAQPIDEMGRLAVERLVEKIEGSGEGPAIRCKLEARLVARGSTLQMARI